MKKSVSILAAVVLAVAITSGITKHKEADALGGQLFGSAVDLFFEDPANNDVTGVEVMVAGGWLNSDAMSVEIHITSVNGSYKDHGTYVFALSDAEVLAAEKAQANVKVVWPDDLEPGSDNIRYTVWVQILANDKPIGDPIETTFAYGDVPGV